MKAKKDRCYIYMRVSTSMQVEGTVSKLKRKDLQSSLIFSTWR